MNYIIEDNINFFNELQKELEESPNKESIVETKNEGICLITHQSLDINYITLECNHRFNYIPLYNEVINQKFNNQLETTHLSVSQIKCPYCRTITNKLLPYIDHPSVTYKKGVNYPLRYCMRLYSCQWIIKSGKNKNSCCSKGAHKSNFGIYCCLHQKMATSKQINEDNKLLNPIIWTEKHKEISRKYKVHDLKQILRDNKMRVGGTKQELIERILVHNIVIHI